PDIFHRNPGLAIDGLLKVKNTKHLVDTSFELLQPALPPCPDLWTYEVDDTNFSFLELFGQAQVEIGKINQHGKLRPASIHFFEQSVEGAVSSRQSADYLRYADHGELVGVHDSVHPGQAHRFAATAEDLRVVEAGPQGGGEFSSINIAGAFAGDDHQARFGHG